MKDDELIYPIQLIRSSLGNEYSPTKTVLASDQMRSITIYCLRDMGDNQFLPLNRDYKPLGLNSRAYETYEEFQFLFIPRDKINFTLLWDNGLVLGSNSYYTFSDGSHPRDSKLFQRYRKIILGTFFGRDEYNNIGTFKNLWGYKEKSFSEYYSYNLSRFKGM